MLGLTVETKSEVVEEEKKQEQLDQKQLVQQQEPMSQKIKDGSPGMKVKSPEINGLPISPEIKYASPEEINDSAEKSESASVAGGKLTRKKKRNKKSNKTLKKRNKKRKMCRTRCNKKRKMCRTRCKK
jgi:hypothetical protein